MRPPTTDEPRDSTAHPDALATTAPQGSPPLRWTDLLAHATLGTTRRPHAPAGTVLGTTLGAAEGPEHAILAAAAALGAGRRASLTAIRGPVPGTAAPPAGTPAGRPATGQSGRDSATTLAPSPPDLLPIAPDRAGQLLEVVLAGEVVQPADAGTLLRAWLAACAATGHRVDPVSLARLLPRIVPLLEGVAPHGRSARATQGGARRPVAPQIPASQAPTHLGPAALARPVDPVTAAAAIGERGRWLAALHPPWVLLGKLDADDLRARLAGSPEPGHGTQEADALDRPTAMVLLRRRDRVAAAADLTAWWPRATAAERTTLLGLLGTRVDPDDEGWLEVALSDPSPSVARAAAGVLSHLPSSRRARRMGDRLRALATVERHRLHRRLVLARPAPPTATDRRDATSDPPKGGDLATWWLGEVVRAAPLAVWADLAGGIQPAVALASDRAVLLGLLAEASTAQGEREWQIPLLQALLAGVGLGAAELGALSPALAAPAEQRARAARTAAVADLAAALPTPWPGHVCRAVLAWALAHPTPGPTLTQLRPALAAGLPPDLIDAVRDHEGYRGTDARQVVLTLSRLRHIMSLRHEISLAFDQPGRNALT